MKVIVTGGAGFIGSTLVDELIKHNHEVIVIDNLSTGTEKYLNQKARFIECDISNDEQFEYAEYFFDGVDVVFHTAAMPRVQPSIEDPVRYHEVNVLGTLKLLMACRDNNVKRFVFSSSSSVYGNPKTLPAVEGHELNPLSPYALNKQMGEQYCKIFNELYGIETVALRYFNVYGDRQPTEGAYCLVMGIFLNQLINGEKLTINGDGEQRRDFTYVGDVVDANIKAAYANLDKFEVFNIGAGSSKSVNHVADLFDCDRIHRDPVIEPRELQADITKAKNILGWKPTGDFDSWCKDWIKKHI
tara:strand:+ start:22163 stop:23065 length:903 start_codon:yes stop_codon:yes gene_type:complete